MTFKKFTPALIASAALVAAAAFAAPAGASGSYSPSLRASGDNAKFAAASSNFAPSASVRKPAPVAVAAASGSYRTYTRAGRTVSTSRTSRTGSTTAVRSSGSELAEAQAILAGLIAKYPILAGSTVTFGDARGYQAIGYYRSGRIVISTTHTASLTRIVTHEAWHIIDYRDNGTIDWGENVPPRS